MLKRLDLIGFKSFADKSTFTFGDGITAIVGPNGSGKSNIVDAVRWILGEQSAKSLRGGEMADVIFNGSATRRSFGMAEVTMTFDNTKRFLGTDADEVQITRRVYRNGEGEYLINQQICRLKDIKELFLGSGAGHNAYSIIEQGRVDVMLQASTKERRVIFEEAAGISRFKAKKTETLRKLLRVDQNLQRLQDIIDEVEKQLRSVKLQASKAQRYQEYSRQLKALRVGFGLREYRELTTQLDAETATLTELRSELEVRAERAREWETGTQQLDRRLTEIEDLLHAKDAELAAVCQQIHTAQTALAFEENTTGELSREIAELREQWSKLVGRVASLEETVQRAWDDFRDAEQHAEQDRQQVKTLEDALDETSTRLRQRQLQLDDQKAAHMENMRQAARLQNEAVVCKAQMENLQRERDRLKLKTERATESLASVDVELQQLQQTEEELKTSLNDSRDKLHEQRSEQDRLRKERDEKTERLSELRQQRSGVASRIEVLQGLIESHEGLGTGVRELYQLLEQPQPGPWQTVLGMVADFITVRHEHAPLIDLALGESAQRFLVRDIRQLQLAISQLDEPFSGRVGFMPLVARQGSGVRSQESGVTGQESGITGQESGVRSQESGDGDLVAAVGEAEAGVENNGVVATSQNKEVALLSDGQQEILSDGRQESIDIRSQPGVVAWAAEWIWCDHPELLNIPSQLLGNTLIVHDLRTAYGLRETHRQLRFLTLDGELLEPDGTLTIGTFHSETGILSRKSELRELQERNRELTAAIDKTDVDLQAIRRRISEFDEITAQQQSEIDVLTERFADLRARLEHHRNERNDLHEEVSLQQSETERIDQEIASLQQALEAAREQAANAEQQVEQLQRDMQKSDEEILRGQDEKQQRQQQCTLAHVNLAKAEERLASLSVQHDQLESDLQLRRNELQQLQQRIRANETRIATSQQTMLQTSSELASGFVQKEDAHRHVLELQRDRDDNRRLRAERSQQSQSVRQEWQQQQEQVHQRELRVNELQHRRKTLVDRLHDDYEIDLAQLFDERSSDESSANDNKYVEIDDAEAATEQMEELRRKLHRLGSVNMEALEELRDLEERANNLNAQHEDLTSAKKSLEDIINKINKDSRRMFTETFETIRGHFQDLFRKCFGGGMADVVLEDDTDILESGIEIIARPPGKELRSISLLSGGEKTMAAVALLLAIFRSKPSPFCILDEVDAALDEANIGRFTSVLREFLDESQFILVTHSKTTMATADVLYGITMQESGVSKQVAVRFEDWPDDPEEAAKPESHLGSFGGK